MIQWTLRRLWIYHASISLGEDTQDDQLKPIVGGGVVVDCWRLQHVPLVTLVYGGLYGLVTVLALAPM